MIKEIMIGIIVVLAAIPVIYLFTGNIASTGHSMLIFSIFVFVWLSWPIIKPYVIKIPLPLLAKFAIIGFIVGLITEYLVFLDQTGLFSGNLVNNLVLSLGIYNTFFIVWYFLLRKFEFSLPETFLTAGVFGIFFEAELAIFL